MSLNLLMTAPGARGASKAPWVRRALLATAGVMAFASPVFAGPPSPPEFSLGFGCAMSALTFSPTETEPFTAFISPGVSGYTEFAHPGNFARLRSASGLFEGTEDANQQHAQPAAAKFATVAALRAALTDPAGWTLEITDGATASTYTFTLSVDASAFPDEYLRPIIFTNVAPGDLISRNPTFTWTQASTSNPAAVESQAFNQLYSDDFANIYTSPSITTTDTAWAPDDTLARNRYTLFIGKSNNKVDQNLITTTITDDTDGDAILYGVFPFITARAFSYCPMLTVSCAGDLNGDGAVNTADLTRFLGQFGKTCPQVTGFCADFNNDGVVNTADLTFFLGRFGGPCI